MHSLDLFAKAKLAALDDRSLRRTLVATDRDDFPHVVRGGRRLLSFSCNDYLGLSTYAAVKAAAMRATDLYGTGAGASRLVTGNHALYGELEERLAAMKRTEAACVFGSGYLANIGVVGVFAGEGDLILVDELAHSCLFAGARLARATTIRFRHNDAVHVRALLAEHRRTFRHALVVTETVFSMDGDRAPIGDLAAEALAQDAWLLTDDAHGFGVVEHPVDAPTALQMGTLSKAVGSYGGYCCASAPVIDLLKTRARSLVYSTGLPPACLAASLASLAVIDGDPVFAARPLANARRFTERLGLPPAQSPIVPLVLGDPGRALVASRALEMQGFLVAAIRPPTVPEGTARLRFAFSALHRQDDIDRLAAAVRAILPAPAEAPCPAFS